ncbi:MAG: transketolase [Christensenellales bacterium]|jgi:transketolase
MSLDPKRKQFLEELCGTFRHDIIRTLHSIQTGHPGGSLSVCEILTSLYFEKADISPENFNDKDRDIVILSKGHAAPMLYRILAEKGFFPVSDLENLRQMGSHLQGHPCNRYTPGVEIASGPLGIAFAAALGAAVSKKTYDDKGYVYVVVGDGETNEGVIWETALAANKFKADRLIAIMDRNGVQLDGTSDEIMPLLDVAAKWRSFGWNVIECDGHDVEEICAAVDKAKEAADQPTMIIAYTVKGKGVSFMEGKCEWHGKPICDSDFDMAIKELEVGK